MAPGASKPTSCRFTVESDKEFSRKWLQKLPCLFPIDSSFIWIRTSKGNGQDDKSKNPSQYTKQSQQMLLKKRWPKATFLKTMHGQDDKSKNPLRYTKQSQQGLLKKGGRRPPFTEARARPRRQEQEPISVHKAKPAEVIEKRWPKATFWKTMQSQDEKGNGHRSFQAYFLLTF